MSPPSLLNSPQLRHSGRRPTTMTRTLPLIGLVVLGFVCIHYVTTQAGGPNLFDSAYAPAWSSPSVWDEGPMIDGPGGSEPDRPSRPPTGRNPYGEGPESDRWYNDIFTYFRPSSSRPASSSSSSQTTCSWLNLPGALKLDRHDPYGAIWESVIRSEGGGVRGRKCVTDLGWMKELAKSVREEDARIRREQLEGRLGDRLSEGKILDGEDEPDEVNKRQVGQEDPFPDPEGEIDLALPTHSLSQLTSKRILLMGDSIERVMFEHLEEIIPRTDNTNGTSLITSTMDETPIVVPNVPMPPGGHARSLSFPTTAEAGASWDSERGGGAMRFDFLHFYGLDDDTPASSQGIVEGAKPGAGIWADKGSHTPGNGPPTLTARFDRMSSVWSEDYDICVIGSGLWDLARFQRTEYISRGVDDSVGLSMDWLTDWAEDASRMIEMVREKYSCRIAWRILHDPRSDSGGWFLPPHLPANVPKTAPFTSLRIHQMRQAQLELVEREGIEMVPFGLVMQAQGNLWLKDDIHPGPGGSAIYAEMLMDMVAERQ